MWQAGSMTWPTYDLADLKDDVSNCVGALANWDGNVASVSDMATWSVTWPTGTIMWPAGSVMWPTKTVTVTWPNGTIFEM